MRGRVIALMLVAALSMGVAQYSAAVQWFSDYLLRQNIVDYTISDEVRPELDKQTELFAAQAYNEALAKGQVQITDEVSDTTYQQLLPGANDTMMAMISIPKIDVVLPVMHGTTDDVLALGAGHYYGTSLPVGGESTHTAITAHSGLVTREFFTRLPELTLGDEFTISSVAGKLYYKVIEMTQVRADELNNGFDVQYGRDLATLVTCVPIGINTHRLLVTGERTAGPAGDDQVLSFWRFPGFPWWAVFFVTAVLTAGVIGKYVLVPYWENQDAKARRAAELSAAGDARHHSVGGLLLVGLLAGLVPLSPIIDPTASYELVIHKHPDTSGSDSQSARPTTAALQGAQYAIEQVIGFDFDGNGAIDPAAEYFDLTSESGWQNASRLSLAQATSTGIVKSFAANAVTDVNGVARVPSLGAGLYLVTETAAPVGYQLGVPFLVTLPMTDPDQPSAWLQTVDVYPKNSPIPTPPTTPTPPVPPTTPPPTSPTPPPPTTPTVPPTSPTPPPTRPTGSTVVPTVTRTVWPTNGPQSTVTQTPAPGGDSTLYYSRDRNTAAPRNDQSVPGRDSILFKTGIQVGMVALAIALVLIGIRLKRRNSASEAEQ